jgi:hypothetical protein
MAQISGVLGELDVVSFEGVADFVDVGSVDADGFVEDLAGDVEFFGPIVASLGLISFGSEGTLWPCSVSGCGMGSADARMFSSAMLRSSILFARCLFRWMCAAGGRMSRPNVAVALVVVFGTGVLYAGSAPSSPIFCRGST